MSDGVKCAAVFFPATYHPHLSSQHERRRELDFLAAYVSIQLLRMHVGPIAPFDVGYGGILAIDPGRLRWWRCNVCVRLAVEGAMRQRLRGLGCM